MGGATRANSADDDSEDQAARLNVRHNAALM